MLIAYEFLDNKCFQGESENKLILPTLIINSYYKYLILLYILIVSSTTFYQSKIKVRLQLE